MNSSDILNLFSSQTIGTSSIPLVLFSVVLAFAVGLGIAAVYRMNFRGVMYSSVVMCIRESIQLSMGMVGALSIVRFRTAVKDPLDTAYMFWALTMGILLGAGQFLLTAVAGVAIAVLITLVCKWRVKTQNCYLLVLRMSEAAEKPAAQVVNSIRFQRLRTKTVMQGAIEATYEVRLDKTEPVLKRLHDIPGMQDATLVAYTGEGA